MGLVAVALRRPFTDCQFYNIICVVANIAWCTQLAASIHSRQVGGWVDLPSIGSICFHSKYSLFTSSVRFHLVFIFSHSNPWSFIALENAITLVLGGIRTLSKRNSHGYTKAWYHLESSNFFERISCSELRILTHLGQPSVPLPPQHSIPNPTNSHQISKFPLLPIRSNYLQISWCHSLSSSFCFHAF